ncbi:MAG: DUF4139 domain-containing protein [Candidatus Delongbacteria bacterium]|nr:DUF4139 domain-containing protein [Candidatus Delongbacteria bacterium]
MSLRKLTPLMPTLVWLGVSSLSWLWPGVTAAGEQEAGIAITVYNQDRAIVTDRRQLQLDRGISELAVPGVSAQVMPQTVGFTAPGVDILEQNFEYDLVDVAKLFQKYLDQSVRLTLESEEVLTGKLLSAGGGIVLEQAGGDIITVDRDHVVSAVFPELPEGLITRPTLQWLVQAERSDHYPVTLTYLTTGMNWSADYVAILNQDDSAMQLGCWVTVSNRTGTSYNQAQLKLIAGDLNLVAKQTYPNYRYLAEDAVTEGGGFSERAFFEYHLYTLARPTNLRNNQDKQLALFPTREVAVAREYLYDYTRDNSRVLVTARFENSEDNQLGIPLPAGVVRVYKLDDDATRQFVGEDRIEHTPRDEPVNLSLGKVFDLVAERTLLSRQPLGRNGHTASIKVELRNHKEESVQVKIQEHIPAGAEITACNVPYEKLSATLVEMELVVSADSTASVEYSYKLKRHGVTYR